MGAHRQTHPVFGIARARRTRILDVGRLQRVVRIRIGEQVVVVAESRDDRLAPAHDEHRLAAPDDLQHLAFLELRGIDGHRRAERLRARARLPRGDERHRREGDSDRADSDRGRRQQAAAAMVNLISSFAAPRFVRRVRRNVDKSSRKPLWP